MDRPRVKIIYTGGTVGMMPGDLGDLSSALVPRPLEESLAWRQNSGLREQMHRVGGAVGRDEEIDFEIESLSPPLDSSSMTPTNWLQIADSIAGSYADFDGFVVLHGTDTMAFTASALSFLFETLDKPIVLTGSQVPLFASRTDARANLFNSLFLASRTRGDPDLVPEVSICFGRFVLRGNRASKVSATSGDAFRSLNAEPLGVVAPGRVRVDPARVLAPRVVEGGRPVVRREMFSERALSGQIKKLELAPDMRSQEVAAELSSDTVRGVVLASYGVGNAPSDRGLHSALRDACDRGVLIVNTTQCVNGGVEMDRYAASARLLDAGVVSGDDMTHEACRAKLYWALACVDGVEAQRAAMQVSQRGEQGEDLVDVSLGSLDVSGNDGVGTGVGVKLRGELARTDGWRSATLRVSMPSFERVSGSGSPELSFWFRGARVAVMGVDSVGPVVVREVDRILSGLGGSVELEARVSEGWRARAERVSVALRGVAAV